ncbi:MAG: molybdenum cofactor biosynthesis protein MoaE [Nitrososphaerota archaeon]|nr:molybdenum cofactor biosynthesis protein MoaE [Nitrososphaerota archaeon]MDG6922225.1 molybdenum cofactor biosynthesis protein MoaE [Nitrososphaerota archaeon]
MPSKKVSTQSGVYPKGSIDFGRAYSEFIARLPPNTGSVTSFLGVSRLESYDGKKKIKYLVMESYEEHANKVLGKICKELKKKYNLTDILIVHALGKFKPGEPVVMVVLSSPRRVQSFKALEEAVERYKNEPALFKQEIYVDGSSAWIH